jgi:hypothetical protein
MTFRSGARALALLALGSSLSIVACGHGSSTSGAGGSAGSLPVGGPCANGVRDPSETDVDCGGACPHCVDGRACAAPSDCASGACKAGVCAACSSAGDCSLGKACVGGVCQGCATNAGCVLGQVCVAGSCAPCSSDAQCGAGLFCTGGTCSPCTTDAQCPPDQGCVQGQCGTCSLSSQCGVGRVCNFGRCAAGFQIDMYQCPGMTDLGGGSWGFYGCQGQLTSTSTCEEIEYPTKQTFPCAKQGRVTIVTDQSAPPAGASYVEMFQCPGAVAAGDATWSFYGCQAQISSVPTCDQIDYPSSQTFGCAPIGKLTVSTAAPPPPPGGASVAMYQCPGVTDLGGGAWGYYGCQGELASTPTCLEIESPTEKSFDCAPSGFILLEP